LIAFARVCAALAASLGLGPRSWPIGLGVWCSVFGAHTHRFSHGIITRNRYEEFPDVMGMLWKRMLQDPKPQQWRRIYKVCHDLRQYPVVTSLLLLSDVHTCRCVLSHLLRRDVTMFPSSVIVLRRCSHRCCCVGTLRRTPLRHASVCCAPPLVHSNSPLLLHHLAATARRTTTTTTTTDVFRVSCCSTTCWPTGLSA
jgi:hypothetical protein